MSPPPEPPQSVHTVTLPTLLSRLGASVLLSTYQAGKLIVVRADGERVNTHVRVFRTPMGLAHSGDRLIVGTRTEIREFRNRPAVAARLPPEGRHDACYLPKTVHTTGQIAGHEISVGAGGEVWVVNTRFSCLCTLDADHSFVPRWRPPFVSALASEDRCHLNGLAMVGGAPKYVTALGATDAIDGWRANKATGGVLLEVPSGRVVAGGLSMPHSPRWHADRLWVLNSGAGELLAIDPADGRTAVVAALPGYLRGLSLVGGHAVVGLCQIREQHIFGGLPIQTRHEKLLCGAAVIDLRTGGRVGLLEFTAGCTEVFEALVVPGLRRPMLMNPEREESRQAFPAPAFAYWLRPANFLAGNRT